MNRIKNKKNPATIEEVIVGDSSVKVLIIYQEKLVRIARERRYKRIPAFLPEQKRVLFFFRYGIKATTRKDFEEVFE